MVSPKRTLQHTPADCLGRLLSAWLLAAAMEYLLLPAASRSLAELLAPANMRLPRVLLMTLAAFILLTLCSTFAPIRRFRRWVPFGNFFLLSVLSLAASFQPVYLGACCLILAVLAVYGAKGWDASPRSLSPAPRRRSDRAWVLASAVLAVLFLLLVSIWTVARYKAFCTSTYDFGIFAQMFHSMRTGGTPLTTLERDGLLSHFQVHVSPSYYLLLPFYCLYPHPETLQVLQAAVLASVVIPMWKLARLHGRSAPECFLLCAIVLLFPPVSAGTGYDIHENCLLLPGLLWLLYAADKKLPWLLAISALLTLGIKEDAAVYVAVAGLYILLRGLLTQKAGRWDRLAGGALTAGAVVWFLAVTAYLATSGDGVMNYRYANFLYNGSNSLVTVIFAVIMCPMKAVYECADPVKLGYLSVSLLPLLGLPLLTRRYERYLLLIPYILVNLMSDYTYQHNIFFQYSFGSAAFLLYLTLVNASDWKKAVPRRLICLAAAAACAIALCVQVVPTALYYPRRCQQNRQEYRLTEAALDKIPADTSVAATGFYTPYLSQRDVLYDVRYTTPAHLLSCRYVVLSLRAQDKEYQTYGGFDSLVSLLEREGYQMVETLPNVLVIYCRD